MGKSNISLPQDVLEDSSVSLPLISCCDHYAGNIKFVEKAFGLQQEGKYQFDVTCDLEDGAPVGSEADYLSSLLELLERETSPDTSFGVRIHPVSSTFWEDEVRQILERVGNKVSYLTVPKSKSEDDVQKVLGAVNEYSNHAGCVPPPLHVLIESQAATRRVWQIAALDGVLTLEFGLMDFISDHGGVIVESAMHSPEQFTHQLIKRVKTEIVAAATYYGKVAVHNPSPYINDHDRVSSDVAVAREQFGFQRMWSIHPSQIPLIVEGMSPKAQEVRTATQVLIAAQEKSWGPIRYNDLLQDRASYRYYWSVLKRARGLNCEIPDEALEKLFS